MTHVYAFLISLVFYRRFEVIHMRIRCNEMRFYILINLGTFFTTFGPRPRLPGTIGPDPSRTLGSLGAQAQARINKLCGGLFNAKVRLINLRKRGPYGLIELR